MVPLSKNSFSTVCREILGQINRFFDILCINIALIHRLDDRRCLFGNRHSTTKVNRTIRLNQFIAIRFCPCQGECRQRYAPIRSCIRLFQGSLQTVRIDRNP